MKTTEVKIFFPEQPRIGPWMEFRPNGTAVITRPGNFPHCSLVIRIFENLLPDNGAIAVVLNPVRSQLLQCGICSHPEYPSMWELNLVLESRSPQTVAALMGKECCDELGATRVIGQIYNGLGPDAELGEEVVLAER